MTFWDKTGGAYWFSLTLPTTASASFLIGRPWLFVGVVLLVVPVLDAAIGRGDPRAGQTAKKWKEDEVPALFILAWTLAMAIGAHQAPSVSWLNLIGLAFGCGMLSATAIAHLHELAHRPARKWRQVCDLAFVVAGYPHYRVAHQLHHRHVGNPKFGSAASLGTSVWQHVGPSYTAALIASFSPRSYPHGRIPRSLFLNAVLSVLLLCLTAFLHWKIAVFYIGYSAISVFVVEAVGYMQHYGFDPSLSGTAITSWDVDFWLSNCLLVNNGFHNAHHRSGQTPYSDLAAQRVTLPAGYFQMLWLTLVPPLWFSIMDRRASILFRRLRRQHGVLRDQMSRDPAEIR